MEPLNIYASNRIFIHNIKPPLSQGAQDFLSAIKQENTIENPAFKEAEKRGRWTGNISPVIALVRLEKQGLSLPRGYAARLFQLAKHFGVEYRFEDLRRELPMVLYHRQATLRPYQEIATTAMLRSTQGVLIGPAGSGKTFCGMEIIARVGQPALWITHTKDLANQAIDSAGQYLGLTGNRIGLIVGKKRYVGDVTIGMVQTLAAMSAEDLDELSRLFGLVILDEAHHVPATTYSMVIDRLPARWRYGLTATPTRADGLTDMIDRFIGPTLAMVERSAVEATGKTIVPRLRTIKTSTVSETFDKHNQRTIEWERLCEESRLSDQPEPRQPQMNYSAIMLDLICDQERNYLIVQTLIQECPGHYSLVLSERVDHIEILAKMLCESEAGLKCAIVHGKLPAKKREAILESMKQGSLQVLFAVDLAKEGLDIPRLDRLFLVAGGNSEAETEQKVGRIQRSSWDKKDAIVFDFVDQAIPVLAAQFWTRRKVYQRLGMLGGNLRSQVS
jgi:superfamily II DNA or RNA helicase